jgi:primosomal protein N' (replication factor Y)
MPKLPLVYRIEVVPLTPLFGRRDPRFSYASPTPLPPGSLVSISFGRRTLTGVTLGSARLPGPVPEWMKYVGVTLLPSWLTADQIALAWGLSERLYTPLGIVLKLFFPLQRKPRTTQLTAESLAADALAQATQPIRKAVRQKKRTHLSSLMEAVPSDTRLLARLIALGGQAVKKQKLLCLLVPEVLSAELYAKRLQAALPQARIRCLSSRRTPKEQYEIFQAIRSQALDIVVGTRQAVFAPYVSLGSIVIIDSEKQLSYSQWEMARATMRSR